MQQHSHTHSDFEFVRSIAEKMRNPIVVKGIVNDPNNRNLHALVEYKYWSDISIGGGYSGILPLFTELDVLFPQEGWNLVAHDYILQIIKAIEADGIHSLVMFGGLAGLCLYLRQASNKERRYKKVLDKIDDFLIHQLPVTHLKPFEEQLKKSIPRRPAFYEVIQGLSGIGIYLLLNNGKLAFKELTHDIIKKLILLTQPIEINGTIVPGWYVSPDFFSLDSDRKINPNGSFNLGLSHGIPGVLAFLSIALMSGIEVEGQKEAINTIANWIQSKRKKNDNRYFWDASHSFEEEISGRSFVNVKSKDAWCYGTPGVARSLYLAGKALKNEAIKEFALEAFISIFKSSRKEWNLPGPTFCHGIAGLLLITQLMAKDTHSPILQEEVRKLREILLSYYDPSFPFGFKNAEMQKNKEGVYAWIDRADILEGASGILLTILALHSSDYQWHLPFLIDDLKFNEQAIE